MRGTRKKALDSHPKQEPRLRTSPAQLFSTVAHLFYLPGLSLQELAEILRLSPSSLKRQLRHLRTLGLMEGRLGSMSLSLTGLSSQVFQACSALIAVETDIRLLRRLHKRGSSALPYKDERGLLAWLVSELPMTPVYRGHIIVDAGHIVMGASDFGMLLYLHASCTARLFDFARLGVEQTDGVIRTHTMMLAHTLDCRSTQ